MPLMFMCILLIRSKLKMHILEIGLLQTRREKSATGKFRLMLYVFPIISWMTSKHSLFSTSFQSFQRIKNSQAKNECRLCVCWGEQSRDDKFVGKSAIKEGKMLYLHSHKWFLRFKAFLVYIHSHSLSGLIEKDKMPWEMRESHGDWQHRHMNI